MSESDKWDLTPAEQIDFARRQMERNVSLKDTLWLVPRESRDKFKEIWKIASLPRTFGEAFGQGFGTPSKFVSNAGEMLKGVGKFWLEVGPQYVGTKLKNLPGAVLPGEGGDDAREALWGMETRLVKQLLTELVSDKPEKIRRLEEQLRAETDPHQIEILRYALDEAHENWRPVMSFMGDEFLYFMDKQELMNRIANNPAEVTADIMSVAAMLVTFGGATPLAVGLKTSLKGQKALKVLKVVGHVVEGAANPTSMLGKGKKVIDLGVRPKPPITRRRSVDSRRPDTGEGKLSTTIKNVPADVRKEAREQAGKQLLEQGTGIVKGKLKSAVVNAQEKNLVPPDDDTDDAEEREDKGADGAKKKERSVGGGSMSSPRFRVE